MTTESLSIFQQDNPWLQAVLQATQIGVVTTDEHGIVDFINQSAEHFTGWQLQYARGLPLFRVLHLVDESSRHTVIDPVGECLRKETGPCALEQVILIHRRKEKEYSVRVAVYPVNRADGQLIGTCVVFEDITELRGLARQLSYQTSHDPLTGLLGRRAFESILLRAFNESKATEQSYILCYIDIDQFKVINATCSHRGGDELLKEIAARLRRKIRGSDTLARLGGDEFAVLLKSCPIAHAIEVANELRNTIKQTHFTWQDKTFDVSASIGIVAINEPQKDWLEVLVVAELACYMAKEQGGNRVQLYEMKDEAVAQRQDEMKWVHRIQEVFEKGQFRLFIQPIESIAKPQQGYQHGEILLRVHSGTQGTVEPNSFVPAAERYYLMADIDRWVVESTLDAIVAQNTLLAQFSTISINLSGQSIADDSFGDFLINKLRASALDPKLICFEITETAVIANLEKARVFIKKLSAMGCRFALDDFGSGMSSFAYLKQLPVEYLKIDGGFVHNMVEDPIDYAMVESMNQIGHIMSIKTIAEFVENEETVRALREIGVDYAQGNGIAPPQPIEVLSSQDE